MLNKKSKSVKSIQELEAMQSNPVSLEVVRGGANAGPEGVHPCGYPYPEDDEY